MSTRYTMDSKRFLLALALSIAVIFAVQSFFPTVKPTRAKPSIDSTGLTVAASAKTPLGAMSTAVVQSINANSSTNASTANVLHAETTSVIATHLDSGVSYIASNIGATLISVVMNAYPNRSRRGEKVDLAANGQPVLRYHIAIKNQPAPIDLSATSFVTTRTGNVVTYYATIAGTDSKANLPTDITIRYTFVPDSYAVHIVGNVAGIGSSHILVDLPSTFTATESDTADDRNYLAYAYRSQREGPHNVLFRSLDPGDKTFIPGPLTWIAAKSKYFVVGILSPRNGPLLDEATLMGGTRTTKVATNAAATAVVPVVNGTFAFDLYTGPQSLTWLEAQGRDFEEVNPYGWAFLHGVMQPIATAVTRLILWMHKRLALSYGMVLVLLGVLIRLILWPLNQSAMRSSLKMQQLQPELQAVQARYKDDLEKQRVEVMKVYSEHGMNPLSPLLGCLPMLLPMPLLFALFFVFRNTIEFRGVSFLWLTDLSSKDPYFLLPVIMGASMYLLSWIGMRNTPPNPQAKLMSYMMPAMFVVFLARAASGLNLYYAVQNIAALPQQWLVARERTQRVMKTKT